MDYLADDAGSERCVVSALDGVGADDATGDMARERTFRRLLRELTPEVRLFVLERRRTSVSRNFDAAIKRRAVADGLCPWTTRLLQISPGEEQLLWFPDPVCSAFRWHLLGRDESYFEQIRHMTRII